MQTLLHLSLGCLGAVTIIRSNVTKVSWIVERCLRAFRGFCSLKGVSQGLGCGVTWLIRRSGTVVTEMYLMPYNSWVLTLLKREKVSEPGVTTYAVTGVSSWSLYSSLCILWTSMGLETNCLMGVGLGFLLLPSGLLVH